MASPAFPRPDEAILVQAGMARDAFERTRCPARFTDDAPNSLIRKGLQLKRKVLLIRCAVFYGLRCAARAVTATPERDGDGTGWRVLSFARVHLRASVFLFSGLLALRARCTGRHGRRITQHRVIPPGRYASIGDLRPHRLHGFPLFVAVCRDPDQTRTPHDSRTITGCHGTARNT